MDCIYIVLSTDPWPPKCFTNCLTFTHSHIDGVSATQGVIQLVGVRCLAHGHLDTWSSGTAVPVYYSLKCLFSIWIYLKIEFISVMAKVNFHSNWCKSKKTKFLSCSQPNSDSTIWMSHQTRQHFSSLQLSNFGDLL